MTRHLALLFTSLITLSGCVSDEDPPIPVTDAAVAVTPDASGSDEPVIGEAQRAFECKLVCASQLARCSGASGSLCYDECFRFSTGTYYCPEQ